MSAGLETFAKVRALHDRAATAGEREAAAGRMAQLARKAGMTVAEAVSMLDAPPPMTPAQAAAASFAEFFNRPEFVAERAEREEKRKREATRIVEERGSMEAVFADTPMEAALRAACEPLLGPGEIWDGIYRLDGWGMLGGRMSMPPSVRTAVSNAWPLPATVAEAWAEHQATEKLIHDRYTVDTYCDPHAFQNARRYIVEELCNTLPAASLDDIRARLSWMEFQANSEVSQDPAEARTTLATLRADIERMAVQFGQAGTSAQNSAHPADDNLTEEQVLRAPDLRSVNALDEGNYGQDPHLRPPAFAGGLVQSGQPEGSVSNTHPFRRTNADKRRDVLALIQGKPGDSGFAPLTDREIARRVGVSPSTVGAIRRSLA